MIERDGWRKFMRQDKTQKDLDRMGRWDYSSVFAFAFPLFQDWRRSWWHDTWWPINLGDTYTQTWKSCSSPPVGKLYVCKIVQVHYRISHIGTTQRSDPAMIQAWQIVHSGFGSSCLLFVTMYFINGAKPCSHSKETCTDQNDPIDHPIVRLCIILIKGKDSEFI